MDAPVPCFQPLQLSGTGVGNELLGPDGRTLRAQLPDLTVTTSTAADAIRTRDAVWTVTGASFTVGLEDGELRREELSAEQRAPLRTRTADLEELTARLRHQWTGTGKDPTSDTVELAIRDGVPLYADDVALRQAARGRGAAAFGTTTCWRSSATRNSRSTGY